MISALFALMLVAQDAPAAAAAPETQVENQEKTSEKKICRTNEGATGSRMRKKMCLTQTEWDRRDQGKSAADLKTIGAR
jgi:hypothetical protein